MGTPEGLNFHAHSEQAQPWKPSVSTHTISRRTCGITSEAIYEEEGWDPQIMAPRLFPSKLTYNTDGQQQTTMPSGTEHQSRFMPPRAVNTILLPVRWLKIM